MTKGCQDQRIIRYKKAGNNAWACLVIALWTLVWIDRLYWHDGLSLIPSTYVKADYSGTIYNLSPRKMEIGVWLEVIDHWLPHAYTCVHPHTYTIRVRDVDQRFSFWRPETLCLVHATHLIFLIIPAVRLYLEYNTHMHTNTQVTKINGNRGHKFEWARKVV